MKKQAYILLFLSLSIILLTRCEVMINPTAEIMVWFDTDEIQTGEFSYDFDEVIVGKSSSEIMFTIENSGNATLMLNEAPDTITVTGDESDFIIDTSEISTELKKAHSTFFSVSFTPVSEGAKKITVSINSNDSDENPFTFELVGFGVMPAISVSADGANIPSGVGFYDFGIIKAGTNSPTVTFTIENLGSSILHLTGTSELVELSGADSTMFNLNQSATLAEIAPNASTTFTVFFAPTSKGDKSATISISNDNPDVDPYYFKVKGEGFTTPEINIRDSIAVDIPHQTGVYDFGKISHTSQLDSIFVIQNLGNDVLEINGWPAVEITGSGASVFSVQMSPDATVQPGTSTNFKIRFKPIGESNYEATVSIPNNDTDENPYVFTIKGQGIAPEINVKDQKSNNIQSGSGVYDFNTLKLNLTKFVTFTIENLGSENLTLNGTPLVKITGSGASAFSVKQNPNTLIAPSSNTTFQIEFSATSLGQFSATVSIDNNDVDEDPYTFTITAICVNTPTNFDFNGDGYDDIVTGASRDKTGGSQAGCVYLFFGSLSPSPTLDASNADIKLIGENSVDRFGFSVSTIGDINKDGYDDIIVGAYGEDDGGQSAGAAYIFYGYSSYPSKIDASNADVKFVGEDAGNFFGASVCSAGDFNHDSYPDVIVGAYYDNDGGTRSGCAFVFFGSSSMASVLDASNADVKLIGEGTEDTFGKSVSYAGDFNDDGNDDIIVGAFGNSTNGSLSGRAYIFFGSQNPVSTMQASNADVILEGNNTLDGFATSVSNAGDFNNDGIDDVIVGALIMCSETAYIFFGSKIPAPLITASNADVKITDGYLGYDVSAVHDFNKDGIDDIIIGDAHDNSGKVYVFYGKSSPAATLSVNNASIIIQSGTKINFGSSVSTAGDFNGDGYLDIIIGAKLADDGGTNSGCVYIYNGSNGPLSNMILSDADTKFVGENANDNLGESVSGGN